MGVDIISTLSRKNGANFAIALGEDILGGFVTVADTTARDLIPTGALRPGRLVRIGTTNNFYEWTGSAWALFTGFGGGGSGHAIKDEGVAVTPRGNLNFVGPNVSLSDDGSNTIVTIGLIALASGVSGVLPVANGGTGLSAGGTNGQILTMVSGAPAWATPGGGSLTAPANPADDGKIAIAASGNFAYALLANANVSATAAIVLSKLADGSACSIVGRSANSSGAHADIASSADGEVFRRAGGALGFGTIATAGIADGAVTLAKLANATSLSVLGRSANSAGVYADIGFANNDEVLMRTAGVLTTGKVADANLVTSYLKTDGSRTLTGTQSLGSQALTNAKSITYGSAEYDNGTSGTSKTVSQSNGDAQKLQMTGNCTVTVTPSAVGWFQIRFYQDGTGGRTLTFAGTIEWAGSPVTIDPTAGVSTIVSFFYDGTTLRASAGSSTIAANSVTLAMMANLAALSVIGNGTNGSATPTALAATTAGQVMRCSGTTVGFGSPDFAALVAKTTAGFQIGLDAGSGSGVASAASAGSIRGARGASAFAINVRNDGDTADMPVITTDTTSGTLTIGKTSTSNQFTDVLIGGSSTVRFRVGNSTYGIGLASSGLFTIDALIASFGTTQTAPVITQNDRTTNGGTGEKLTIHAQNETGTTSTGGALDVAPGSGTTAGGLGRLVSGSGSARVGWNDTGLGFFGTTPVAKPTVTGSRGSNAALASLLTALANFGILTDSST